MQSKQVLFSEGKKLLIKLQFTLHISIFPLNWHSDFLSYCLPSKILATIFKEGQRGESRNGADFISIRLLTSVVEYFRD